MTTRTTTATNTRATNTRATTFASAVLLVVLLATSGWPGEAQPLVDNTRVTSCEASVAAVGHAAIQKDARWSEQSDKQIVCVPRVRPRHSRVDSWGLPLPRAPTC